MEMNAASHPFDYSQPNSRLSWSDFSEFYKNANEWGDYPVDNRSASTSAASPLKNGLAAASAAAAKQLDNADIFKNHGSRNSMDVLADEMNNKWSYDVNNANNHDDYAANHSNNLPIADNSNHNNNNSNPITGESEEIKRLKDYIAKIESEKQELMHEIVTLKQRNSDLRKALNKAQQYRRKSSVAVANLMNIGDKLSEERKVMDDDELRDLQIQQQIQSAIAMFQEEFGAELDEELNNISTYEYDPVPDHSRHSTDGDHDIDIDIDDHGDGDDEEEEQRTMRSSRVLKIADARTPNAAHSKGYNQAAQFLADPTTDDEEDNGDDDDAGHALPDAHHYVTPGNVVTTNGGDGDGDDDGHRYITPGNDDDDGDGGDDYIQLENGRNNVENERKLQEMEQKLNGFSEKILSLMQRIEELTDRNQQLEISKMELIASTSTAMNEYRNSIRYLSEQNEILSTRLRRQK